MIRIVFIAGILWLAQIKMEAQIPDSSAVLKGVLQDTGVVTPQHGIKSWSRPKKALLLSLVLPGAGQIYNKRYWKLPIVAGGFYLSYRAIAFNLPEYRFYERALYSRVTLGVDLPGIPASVSDDQIRQVRDGYNKQLQTSALLTGLFYLVVASDAFVDAHLASFDVSDDLSIEIVPVSTTSGLGLRFNLNRPRPTRFFLPPQGWTTK